MYLSYFECIDFLNLNLHFNIYACSLHLAHHEPLCQHGFRAFRVNRDLRASFLSLGRRGMDPCLKTLTGPDYTVLSPLSLFPLRHHIIREELKMTGEWSPPWHDCSPLSSNVR